MAAVSSSDRDKIPKKEFAGLGKPFSFEDKALMNAICIINSLEKRISKRRRFSAIDKYPKYVEVRFESSLEQGPKN
jgi:hypothetical protein